MDDRDKGKLTRLINTTGFPFQEECFAAVTSNEARSRAVQEYPYRLDDGTTGSIDILSYQHSRDTTWSPESSVIWSIECKRSDPKYKNWCFVRSGRSRFVEGPVFSRFSLDEHKNVIVDVYSHNQMTFTLGKDEVDLPAPCLFSYEMNDAFDSINRNLEEKVYKAALQSFVGLRHLVEYEFKNGISELHLDIQKIVRDLDARAKNLSVFHIPIVVTTAKLYSAEVDAAKVSGGIVHPDGVAWKEENFILYDVSIPSSRETHGRINWAVFVVTSEYFSKFYKEVFPRLL